MMQGGLAGFFNTVRSVGLDQSRSEWEVVCKSPRIIKATHISGGSYRSMLEQRHKRTVGKYKEQK